MTRLDLGLLGFILGFAACMILLIITKVVIL